MSIHGAIPKSWLFQKAQPSQGSGCSLKWAPLVRSQALSVPLRLQGYTLADEEEDPLIYRHRMLRSGQGDASASGPVETGPMKKLHVSTINLQKAGPWFPGCLGRRALLSFRTFSSCCLQCKTTKNQPKHFPEHLDTRSLGHFIFLRVSEL